MSADGGERGAGAVLKVRYSRTTVGKTDPWTQCRSVVPDVASTVGNVYFNVTADADPSYCNVRAEIPASAASPAGSLFGRFDATEN